MLAQLAQAASLRGVVREGPWQCPPCGSLLAWLPHSALTRSPSQATGSIPITVRHMSSP